MFYEKINIKSIDLLATTVKINKYVFSYNVCVCVCAVSYTHLDVYKRQN